jgi:murein DD-endopeptidase MepM/ murein hydrolase activator NlpD
MPAMAADLAATQNPFQVTVKNGDTLYSLARQYGVELKDLANLNKLKEPYTISNNQIIRLPKAAFHIVKDKDTIYAISKSYGVSVSAIATANHLQEPYKIHSGMKLWFTPPASNVAESTSTNKDGVIPIAKPASLAVTSKDLGNLSNKKVEPLALSDEEQEEIFFGNYNDVVPEKPETKTAVKAPAPSSEEKDAFEQMIFAATELTEEKPVTPVLRPAVEQQPAVKIAKAQPQHNFLWPAKGKIVSRFGPKDGGLYNDGINIAAKEGAAIKSAEKGEVVYSGNELRGYGNLLLIKHDNGFVTAYAHAQKLLAKKGDMVDKGQIIAYVGNTGHVSQPQLHFSIRKGRKAIDPEKYLPKGAKA